MNPRTLKWIIRLLLLLFILGAAVIFSLCVGSSRIPLADIPAILLGSRDSVESSIVLDLRLPRILLAIAVGGGLSLAGVLLQGMFRNPLVAPYTVGISGGAAFGVSLGIVLGAGHTIGVLSLPISGFLGAGAVIVLVYALASGKKHFKIQGLLLTGVMISFITSSAIMLIMSIAETADLQGIVFWIMGSLDEPKWELIIMVLAVSVVGLVLAYFFSFRLNALILGEDEARHLGIDTDTTRRYLFIIASLLTGCCVAVTGIIGFVGLVVPHFARMYLGRDHRILLVGSFLSGAIFLILCDTIARTIISPLELPVGVITGIFGGILFVYALGKRKVAL